MTRTAPTFPLPAAGAHTTDTRRPVLLGLLDRLAEADRRHRATRQARRLDDARLDDIGLSRAALEAHLRG